MQIIVTFENPIFTVSKRDGSSVDVDLSRIPESLLADFLPEGVMEYIRDSSSTALANAFELANPDHGLTGQELVAARASWAEGNVSAIKAASEELMQSAIERLYAGERRANRAGSGETFTEMEDEIYSVVSDAAWKKAVGPQFPDVIKAFKAAKGLPTAERKRAILDVIEAQDEARRNFINKEAKRRIADRAKLAAALAGE